MNIHTGVLIGRFQPVHQGHLFVIEQALKHCDQLVIMLGSSYRANTIKNPFNTPERIALLRDHFAPEWQARIHIEPLEDTMYDEPSWIQSIRQAVNARAQGKNIAVIGHDKDPSTYYLKHFPDWELIELGNYQNLDATLIRKAWFSARSVQAIDTIPGLTEVSRAFLTAQFGNERYQRLKEEFEFIQAYKTQWAHTPYPVLFNTTDA